MKLKQRRTSPSPHKPAHQTNARKTQKQSTNGMIESDIQVHQSGPEIIDLTSDPNSEAIENHKEDSIMIALDQ